MKNIIASLSLLFIVCIENAYSEPTLHLEVSGKVVSVSLIAGEEDVYEVELPFVLAVDLRESGVEFVIVDPQGSIRSRCSHVDWWIGPSKSRLYRGHTVSVNWSASLLKIAYCLESGRHDIRALYHYADSFGGRKVLSSNRSFLDVP